MGAFPGIRPFAPGLFLIITPVRYSEAKIAHLLRHTRAAICALLSDLGRKGPPLSRPGINARRREPLVAFARNSQRLGRRRIAACAIP